MPEAGNKICFIVNPVSGRHSKNRIDELIRKEFGSTVGISIRHTGQPGHGAVLSREALREGFSVIVAVGGDGTVNEVAGPMIGTRAALGIVPLGSGNGLARHLGIPLSPEKALRMIHHNGQLMQIDTGTINDRHFLSLAGVGFDALVAGRFAEVRSRGFFSYFRIIARSFFQYKPESYRLIFSNGEEMETSGFFITAANSSQFGYNTLIAPRAKLNDGLLDLVIVKKPQILEMPIIAYLLLMKRIDLSSRVKILSTSGVTINRAENGPVNIDGEAMTLKNTLNIGIKPLSLNIIVPDHEQEKS